MKNEIEYKILHHTFTNHLESNVKELLNKGWAVAGGICCSEMYFYQAMVKYNVAEVIAEEDQCCKNCRHEKLSEYVKPCSNCDEDCSHWSGK